MLPVKMQQVLFTNIKTFVLTENLKISLEYQSLNGRLWPAK